MDEASGDGSAELQPNGSLKGQICLYGGDEANFTARPWKTSSTACQRPTSIWRAHGLQPRRVRQFKLSKDPKFIDTVTLDLDDTVDVVHGHQQLSLFNSHYHERYFLSIHVYDTMIGRSVAMLLRPGQTPSGRRSSAIC
jgi:hypothetical protein